MKIKICKKVKVSMRVKQKVCIATVVLGSSVLLWIFPLGVQPLIHCIALPTVLYLPWTQ